MTKCKITVLKREFYKELADEYISFPDFGPCHMMKEGDVFITTDPPVYIYQNWKRWAEEISSTVPANP